MGDSATGLERTIIEASALLVTLLFIVAQVGKGSTTTGFMEWLSAIGFFFIGAIAVSAFSMWEEHSTTATRFLRAFAFLLFFVGLLFIAATFLGWSVPTNGCVIAIFFGYAIIGGVGMAYSEHRRLRKLKEPMIS
jgi:phosphatidylserine synthase